MVMAYGTAQRVQGATRFVLSRRDRQLLAGEPVELAAHLLQRDILVVASDDDRVITVAHRTGRIPRQLQPRWRRRTH